MTWILKKDTLFSKTSTEIGYFLPTANEKERTMIKDGDDLIDLVGEFVINYDETKAVSKKLYDSLNKIIAKNTNYKLTWRETQEGELLNENDNVIFIFVKSDSVFAKIITLLPEVYTCSQDLLNDLSSVKQKREIKKCYDRICDFYDKTSEN